MYFFSMHQYRLYIKNTKATSVTGKALSNVERMFGREMDYWPDLNGTDQVHISIGPCRCNMGLFS